MKIDKICEKSLQISELLAKYSSSFLDCQLFEKIKNFSYRYFLRFSNLPKMREEKIEVKKDKNEKPKETQLQKLFKKHKEISIFHSEKTDLQFY